VTEFNTIVVYWSDNSNYCQQFLYILLSRRKKKTLDNAQNKEMYIHLDLRTAYIRATNDFDKTRLSLLSLMFFSSLNIKDSHLSYK